MGPMRAAFAIPLTAAVALALACGASGPETRLAAHALAPAVAEFGDGADALEAHTLPLGRDGLWLAVTNGPQPFRETADGETVNFFHFAAIYRRLDDGTWSAPLTRLTIESAPHLTEVELIGEGAAIPVFIAVRGHTGAHSGTLDLLRFDGERLETALSHVSARAHAGVIADLDGDDVPEVALNDSDPYVFCYTCAVEEKRERLYRLMGADWVEVELAAPPGLPPELAARAERTVTLARAGLWREAAALAIAVAREAPGNDGARWFSILVNRTAAARLAHAGSPGQPLLTNVLAGEYDAAFALMAGRHPARAFALDGPLIAGTAASDEAGLRELAARLLDATGRALTVRPDDPAILAVRALGFAIASPNDLARARAAISAAVAFGPDDRFLQSAYAWLRAVRGAPGLPATTPPSAFEDPGIYYGDYTASDQATREAVRQMQIAAGRPPTGVPEHGEAGEPIIYLTFDDGPHPYWTPQILDALARYEAVATFFVTGVRTSTWPDLVRRMVEAGHEVENHTFNHEWPNHIDRETFIMEVHNADRAIREAVGEHANPVPCFRPAYGIVDERTHAIARELGKAVTLWSIDSLDWQLPTAEQIADHVLANARPGAILLLHEAGGWRSPTLAALEIALAELVARGYAFALLCA